MMLLLAIHPEVVLRVAYWLFAALIVVFVFLMLRRRASGKRKPAAQALLPDRPKMLQAAFDRAQVGVGFVTGDGQWLEVNRRLLSILGYMLPSDLDSFPLRFLTHPDDRKREAPLLAEIRAGKRSSYAITKRLMRKGGDYRSARVHMLRCAESPQPLYQVIIDDSTQQTPVEAMFAAMSELDSTAVILCDASGSITGWNKGAERLFGHTADEVVSSPWMKLHTGETKESLTRLIGTAAQNGYARALNKRVLSDGSHVVVKSVIIPDLLRGDVGGFVEICHVESAAVRQSASDPSALLAKSLEENAKLRDALARAESTEAELRTTVTELRTMNGELSKKLRLAAGAIRKMLPAQKVETPRSTPAAPAVASPWHGVASTDFSEALSAVAEQSRSGILHLRSDHGQKRFVFENGRLIACSSDRDERLLGQLLVDAGVIDDRQRSAALAAHRETGLPFGSSLVKLGLASEEDVAEIIRAKAKNEIAEAAAWQRAEWAFTESTPAAAAMIPIAIDVLAVLAELTPAAEA
jgi:PAS domain S-box-containing protein